MFSNRFDWDAPPNALGVLLAQKKAAGRPIHDLTLSNPTRAGFGYDAETVLTALSRPASLIYTPEAQGAAAARQAIAGYYADIGAGIDPGRIFLTAGTSEAYALLFKLLGNPGDEVLIPRPGYPLLSYLTRLEGLAPIAYPLQYDDENGWCFNLEILSALITDKTRAVVIVSPNNPTGSYIKEDELMSLDALCGRHEIALVIDEVFSDYIAADAPGAAVKTAAGRTRSLCFVLNGFSKMLALPQMKLGWIIVNGDAEAVRSGGRGLEALIDFYLTVSAPVQHAAGDLLRTRRPIQEQILSRIDRNQRLLEGMVASAPGFRILRREGGWYAIVDIADALGDEERAVQLLNTADTLVHPGYFYDFGREGFVVVSLLPPEDVFAAGVRSLVGLSSSPSP